MKEYAKVVFRWKRAEVILWVAHEKGASEDTKIKMAEEELLYTYDIDVRLLGDWKAEVV